MMWFICPTIVPVTVRDRHLLAEVRKRGLSLHRLHGEGMLKALADTVANACKRGRQVEFDPGAARQRKKCAARNRRGNSRLLPWLRETIPTERKRCAAPRR